MFRSSFSKYLITFILIIVISFLLMTGIVVTMVSKRVNKDMQNTLCNYSHIISDSITLHFDEPDSDKASFNEIKYLLKIEKDLVIIFTEFDGKDERIDAYITSSVDAPQPPPPGTGAVDLSDYERKTINGVDCLYKDGGVIKGITEVSSRYCATSVTVNGEHKGYVIAALSSENEEEIMSPIKTAMLNGTLWVLLAAIIAVYFITERIVHPLRDMTHVVKSYSKGDFSQRVMVHGKDEVAELGLAFNNMAASLDNLEKMRNSFLASVSHDLRTPMTTISGFIDGINSGAIPEEKQEYYLGVISAEVHRLSRLVSQLLDVSRLESGDRKFNMADFDIAELARIVLISFESKIEEKRLDVEFYSHEDSMFVHGDKDALHQVLYNLCHNAMKFSREGGKFKIDISYNADKKIEVRVFNEGQGIAAENIDMIFDRFYKTDESRGLDKTGVGLGLYISKTIIEAHGEKISVRSAEGEFCEFSFTLPQGEKLVKRRHTAPEGGEVE